MERLAYFIKHRLTFLFPIIERVAALVTEVRYGKKRREALSQATIRGTFNDNPCLIRALSEADAKEVSTLLQRSSEAHTEYFHPHKFDKKSVEKVLKSASFMTYGVFLNDAIIAYALLRLAPNGNAYVGDFVDEAYTGKGLGKYLARFLYWQSAAAGFKPRATISKNNSSSFRSHSAAAEYRIVAELMDDFLMLEFDATAALAPSLRL